MQLNFTYIKLYVADFPKILAGLSSCWNVFCWLDNILFDEAEPSILASLYMTAVLYQIFLPQCLELWGLIIHYRIVFKNYMVARHLLKLMGIPGVEEVMDSSALRWLGHVERKEDLDWVSLSLLLLFLIVLSQFSLWITKSNSVGPVHVACVWHPSKRRLSGNWTLGRMPFLTPPKLAYFNYRTSSSFSSQPTSHGVPWEI